MPVAISIKVANATAGHIHQLWAQAGRFEEQPSMAALGYPPHITMAIYDDLAPADLEAAFDAAFGSVAPFHISFNGIRCFEGVPLVLWAAPAPCAALDRAHAIIHRLIDPAQCRPYYRPGAWVPHCTLATQVAESRRVEALAFAQAPIAPFELRFDVADCITFFPIAVARERQLVAVRD